ncbi:MAG: response regulator receiver protein [Chloroflexi bacterium OLB14]|nr:MAG: response regulator receiver protein [Chloroflexi bacterium OLB14]
MAQRKKRVLIADDVHETRRNTRVMLSMIDSIEVIAIATDGLQAIEMAREYKPDIVVLDINMPKVNGLLAYKKNLAGKSTNCLHYYFCRKRPKCLSSGNVYWHTELFNQTFHNR